MLAANGWPGVEEKGKFIFQRRSRMTGIRNLAEFLSELKLLSFLSAPNILLFFRVHEHKLSGVCANFAIKFQYIQCTITVLDLLGFFLLILNTYKFTTYCFPFLLTYDEDDFISSVSVKLQSSNRVCGLQLLTSPPRHSYLNIITAQRPRRRNRRKY